ncbi:MAG TPA: hypothetical protein VGU43_07615 [Thermoplasmata archaeon]|nr:hypothetical protein [Thermoplasmata archaeon]
MGRTVPTYRDALTDLLARWDREFGRALTQPADRLAFRELVLAARRYVAQGTQMSSGDLVERVLLSVLVDLFRRAQEREGMGSMLAPLPLERFDPEPGEGTRTPPTPADSP